MPTKQMSARRRGSKTPEAPLAYLPPRDVAPDPDAGLAELRHESRNAFQRLQANLDFLKLELAERPEVRTFLQAIDNAQSQLHDLFENYCTFHGSTPFVGQTTDLMTTWRNAWQQLVATREARDAELDEERLLQAPICHGDGERLKQVFFHLFENSLAAAGGTVLVSISTRPAQLHGRGAIEVSVRDDGPGIPLALGSRIFEPYFTTKHHCTGLGLPICQRIVAAHHGLLTLNLGPSRGAEFLLTLPVDDRSSSARVSHFVGQRESRSERATRTP